MSDDEWKKRERAWAYLVRGLDGLLISYRIGKEPTKRTWKDLERAKKILGDRGPLIESLIGPAFPLDQKIEKEGDRG